MTLGRLAIYASMIFAVCVGLNAFASPSLSKGEFLSGIMNGSVSIDGRQPYFKSSMPFVKKQVEIIKMTHPEFTEKMYGYFFKLKGSYMYSIAYNWQTKECWYEMNKLDGKGNIEIKSSETERAQVPISICEKLYDFKSK